MKLKRILAMTMAASLLVSSSLMGLGTKTVYAQNLNETVHEIEKNDEQPWSGIPTVPEKEQAENEIQKEIKDSDLNKKDGDEEGVKITDDLRPLENKTEVESSVEEEVQGNLEESGKVTLEEIDRDNLDVDLRKEEGVDSSKIELLNEETVRDNDMVRVIIVMDGKSIIEKDSDATMNFFTKAKANIMESKQKSVVTKIEKKVLDGDKLDIRYHYTWMLNGVATEVPYGMIDEIEAINGVDKVILQAVYDVCDTTTEADTYTVSDGVMIGREDTWASGYTGKGEKIAIIDTGIDDDHQNFVALSEDKLTSESATKDTIASVVDQLNASDLYKGLTADHLYRSTKIAYGFNYVDKNIRINHSGDKQGDHGTHVAGIAAANDLENGEAVGVAPDAQLYVMKVFGANGGAYTEDILAALEDSLILGADVVNMSLGSPAGFTSGGEYIDEIYSRVSKTNTILAVAAGNASSVGVGNMWGTDTNLTSNPDNSTVSSPATYINATSVASVDNVGSKSYYIEANGKKLAYVEGANGKNKSMLTLGGQEYEFAMVENCGQSASDFTAADVAGKVAVVQRGVTAFSEKCKLAQDAGAIACFIYNNTSGTINIDMTGGTATIPCASITLKAGEYLAATKAEKPEAKLLISADQTVVESETGYKMSDFSSWGISPNLSLEPDVTAPGGNIYSTLDDGKYGVMSGTSMASPNMAGVSALVSQYVKDNFPEMSDPDKHFFINALLMSTAEPLMYNETEQFSPRSQGSGLVNAYNAVNTKAYLTVDGMDTPKIELKDDPEKTGSYTYKFNVKNFGDKAAYYDLDTTALTEGALFVEELAKNFMSLTPVALDASTFESSEQMVYTYDYNENNKVNTSDARQLYLKVQKDEVNTTDEFFRYNLDKDEDGDFDDVQAYLDALVGKEVAGVNLEEKVLKVNAGEDATVSVGVQVSDAGKAYMDANFENGIYVEGFTILTAKNESGVDLSLPYMGFYGDWTKAPIIDSGFYWDDKEEMVASQYVNILFTNLGDSENGWLPGLNPYVEEEFDQKHISFSPNNDGNADCIEEIYLSLLRNAKNLSFIYSDAETGKVYNEINMSDVEKCYFQPNYGQIIPFVYSWYGEPYAFTDLDGNTLANNTKLNLTIKATLDYDKHESNNVSDTWEIPMTVDTEAPVITEANIYTDEITGKQYLKLTFQDNVDVAAINFLNKSGTMLLAQYPVENVAAGESCTKHFDITGFGNEFNVIAGDYALNESAYKIKTENNDPVLDTNQLYGYRVADDAYKDDRLYGWLSINPEDAATQILDSEYYVDYALTAAEYVGGYILAVDANNDLLFIKPGYWDERTKIASLGVKIRELTFDPTSCTLYGYDSTNQALVTIDIYTGAVEKVSSSKLSSLTALACDDEGTLYGIDTNGVLKLINKVTGNWADKLMDTRSVTGGYPFYAQSMTYDSEEECLLWAYYDYSNSRGSEGSLYKIDVKNNFAMTKLGTIAGEAEVVGLLKLDDKGFTLPETEIESIKIQPESVTLFEEDTKKMDIILNPWYGEVDTITWTTEDPNVATITENGEVTAQGVGQTTVTASTEDGRLQASSDVYVVHPNSQLNGFVMSGDTLFNQWVSFNADNVGDAKVLTEQDFRTYYAGEYLDGFIYAYNASTELYKINADTKEAQKISDARSDYLMADMAYDYSSGFMYGIAQDTLYGDTKLVVIDIMTGAFQVVGTLADDHGYPACALAIATDGTIYVLSLSGILNTFNVQTGQISKIGSTGYTGSQYTQSMAYDHNTNELYWAMISGTGIVEIMYVDTKTGVALPLGNFDGGVQMSSMYVVPENVPEREEVPVESVRMTSDSVTLLNGVQKCVPVEVLPFNATDRAVKWTVADENVAVIENGMIKTQNVGTTTATGTLAGYTVTLNIQVVPSAGALHGYILSDLNDGSGLFWGEFNDSDLSSGNGLANGSEYQMYAGEYYNGKIYGYGVDKEADYSQFMVVNGETFELEKAIIGEFPDMLDMAFDYSQGVMYAVGGVKNVASNKSLYAVDINDGNCFEIAKMDQRIMTLACTTEGTLYGIDENGSLFTINKATGELTHIGDTGYGANLYQSMAYDHNTGNLYWAQAFKDPISWSSTATLLLVNPKDASVVNLGNIGVAGCVVSALHIVPKQEIPIETPDIESVRISSESEMLSVRDSVKLSAKALPLSVALNEVAITFTSTDNNVATVDENGLVRAVGEGHAEIIASCGDVKAICVVSVVSDKKELYVVNTNGWEKSPLLSPGTITESVTLPENTGLNISTVTYHTDGYFYAIDAEGYLWKYTEDLTIIEKVSDKTVVSQLDNLNDFATQKVVPSVVDLVSNAFTNKVYVMVKGVIDNNYEYFIYELDLNTSAATATVRVPLNIMRPIEFVFSSETNIMIYDAFDDYLYKMNLNSPDDADAEQVCWAQAVMSAGYSMGMAYSQELDMIFIGATSYDNNSQKALYILNPKTGLIKHYADAAYNFDMVDIILIEGSTPVTNKSLNN